MTSIIGRGPAQERLAEERRRAAQRNREALSPEDRRRRPRNYQPEGILDMITPDDPRVGNQRQMATRQQIDRMLREAAARKSRRAFAGGVSPTLRGVSGRGRRAPFRRSGVRAFPGGVAQRLGGLAQMLQDRGPGRAASAKAHIPSVLLGPRVADAVAPEELPIEEILEALGMGELPPEAVPSPAEQQVTQGGAIASGSVAQPTYSGPTSYSEPVYSGPTSYSEPVYQGPVSAPSAPTSYGGGGALGGMIPLGGGGALGGMIPLGGGVWYDTVSRRISGFQG